MFRGLCGAETYKNVVLLTTHWDQVSNQEGVKREDQLKSKFFKDLVAGGACFMRHDRTVESTFQVFRHILSMPPAFTQIQKEIREEGKSLADTAAGSVHSEEVERELAKCKNDLADLTVEVSTLKESNKAARQELEAERAELRRALARLEDEKLKLKELKKNDAERFKKGAAIVIGVVCVVAVGAAILAAPGAGVPVIVGSGARVLAKRR